MTVTLYNAKIKPRALVKERTQIASGSGSLKESTDIENPTIARLALTSAPSQANYMYIPEFGRYYFITEKSADPTNGLWNISGHVDVLTSMWPQLQNQGAILRRQTQKFNLYLDDPMFPIQANRSPQIINFPRGFTSSQKGACVVVTLIGADS